MNLQRAITPLFIYWLTDLLAYFLLTTCLFVCLLSGLFIRLFIYFCQGFVCEERNTLLLLPVLRPSHCWFFTVLFQVAHLGRVRLGIFWNKNIFRLFCSWEQNSRNGNPSIQEWEEQPNERLLALLQLFLFLIDPKRTRR